MIVLYELMTNGSLRGQLDSGGVLSMDTRVEILRGGYDMLGLDVSINLRFLCRQMLRCCHTSAI